MINFNYDALAHPNQKCFTKVGRDNQSVAAGGKDLILSCGS